MLRMTFSLLALTHFFLIAGVALAQPSPTTWGHLKGSYGQIDTVEAQSETVLRAVTAAIITNPLLTDPQLLYVGKVGPAGSGFIGAGYLGGTEPFLVFVNGNFNTTRCFCFETYTGSSEVGIVDLFDHRKLLWRGVPPDPPTSPDVSLIRNQIKPLGFDAQDAACWGTAMALGRIMAHFCEKTPNPLACGLIGVIVEVTYLYFCYHPDLIKALPGEEIVHGWWAPGPPRQ